MAMMSLIFGGYLAVIGKDSCVGVFVGAAFSAKVTQKFFEMKKSTKTTESSMKIESHDGI
jgi:hypothetical protein